MQAKEHHPLDFVCETGVCIPCLPMHLHHTFPELYWFCACDAVPEPGNVFCIRTGFVGCKLLCVK